MIDEKKLWDERPEWLNPIQEGREDFNEGWNACNGHWFDLIKSQPTIQQQGIDKDRLIEELEKEKKLAELDSGEQCRCDVLAFEKVIKMVNQQPITDGWIPQKGESNE